MSNNQVGRKYDQGKPLSGTVLAGFWRVAGRGEFAVALTHGACALDEEQRDKLIDVLDYFFDVNMPISARIEDACDELTTHINPEYYMRGAIEVGSYGARKYDRDNWLHVNDGINRYYEAVGRHVEDLICGHWYDDDKEGPNGETVEGSHLPNLSHIFWGILAAGELVGRKRDAETFEGEAADVVLEIDHEAEERAAHAEILSMTHLFVKPEPLPGLVLPLEVGRKYAIVHEDGERNEGVAERTTSYDGRPVVLIGPWAVYADNAEVPGIEAHVEAVSE